MREVFHLPLGPHPIEERRHRRTHRIDHLSATPGQRDKLEVGKDPVVSSLFNIGEG